MPDLNISRFMDSQKKTFSRTNTCDQYNVFGRPSKRDFGHIETAPMNSSNLLLSQRIDKNHIAHLSLVQQQELLAILDEFSECFSDKPGLLTNVEHEIVPLQILNASV